MEEPPPLWPPPTGLTPLAGFPPPLTWWQRVGWLGRSAFTLTKRTCFVFKWFEMIKKLLFGFPEASKVHLSFADLRHRLEKLKCRKLSKEERSIFLDKTKIFVNELVSAEPECQSYSFWLAWILVLLCLDRGIFLVTGAARRSRTENIQSAERVWCFASIEGEKNFNWQKFYADLEFAVRFNAGCLQGAVESCHGHFDCWT